MSISKCCKALIGINNNTTVVFVILWLMAFFFKECAVYWGGSLTWSLMAVFRLGN